jgi:hypothetical protein
MEKPSKKEDETSVKKRIIRILIFVAIIIFLIPIGLYLLIVEIIYRIKFQSIVISKKKRIIFVTSESPIWHDYLNNKWIPLIKEHAYILNWSQRKEWDESQWEVKAFHHWGRDREMNPIFIIYGNLLNIQVFRMYEPFIDYKHGKEKKLLDMEKEIEKSINSIYK